MGEPVPNALLSGRGLVVGYGDVPRVGAVELELRTGEFVAVLGPNGAGKTTLLKTLAGVLPPLQGRVEVFGDELSSLGPREVARRVAVLPQETAPLFSMSVLAAVLLGRAPWHDAWSFETRDDVEIARASLGAVGAAHLIERDVTELSGGERRRVHLARALAQQGRVLLCDEPTAGLDLKATGEVFEHLRRLADAGQAVLVVTHELELAAALCDRVMLLANGRALGAGAAADVLTTAHLRDAFDVELSVEQDRDGRVRIVRDLTSDDWTSARKGQGEDR